MMEKDISANLYQKYLVLCSKILVDVFHNMSIPFLLPWQHTGFQTSLAPHLWRSVLIFVNGASSARSCQNIKILGRVCGLGKCFSSLRSPNWERVSCHRNQFLYSCRCVAFRTISSPTFNGLCCKLTEMALFIFLMFYWIGRMTSSAFSFAYFTHFSNLNISGTNEDISKR